MPVPIPRPRLLACAAAALVLAVAAGAAGAAADGPPSVIGGSELAGRGVVVNLAPGVPPLPQHLTARSWLVADSDTGAVLAARDAHGRFLPASTLKTLTAVTLIPLLNPHQRVTATAADVSVDGSKVGLVPGGQYPISQLFTAMLVVSGNDAANTLADAAGGQLRALALMNAEARNLNADDTVAKTPSGLDAPGETSSAYDLALIARAGLVMPAFRHYVGTVLSYVSNPHGHPFQIYTHDRLLLDYPGAIGIKNGYTVAAQGTYIGAATRGGHTLIVTLLHANPDFWPDAESLLTWGFKADNRVVPVGQLVPPGQLAATAAPAGSGREAAGARGHFSDTTPVTHRSDLTLPLSLAAVSALLAVFVSRRGQKRRRALRLPPV